MTKTAHSYFDNTEKGNRQWSRDDEGTVTDINRGTAQLKTWQKTESKGHSEFDGTYELFSVAETNLYANGTTDSFSKSESTDDGLTKSDSDITVTSKATDARQAPGYDIDAKVGAPQTFTGTVLIQSGKNHTTSQSNGTLWTYGLQLEQTNTLGVSTSITQSDSKSKDKGSSTYKYDNTTNSATVTLSPIGLTWSTASEVKHLEGKDSTKSKAMTHDLTVNGIHTAYEQSQSDGKGTSKEKVTTIRHQDCLLYTSPSPRD